MRGFGAEFKHTLSRPGPWTMSFYGFGECLPNHENFIELDKTKVDAWGIPVLRISCVWRENERALLKDMSITAAEMLSAAGARDIEPIHRRQCSRTDHSRNGHGAHGTRSENFGAQCPQPGA